MRNFVDAFTRDPDGSWICVRAASVELAEGRIAVTPGTRFAPGTRILGVEPAALLEREAVRRFHEELDAAA
jgi:hypothetical protein